MEAYEIFFTFILMTLVMEKIGKLEYVNKSSFAELVLFMGGKETIKIDSRLLIYSYVGLYSAIASVSKINYCMEVHEKSGKLIKPFTPEDLKMGLIFLLIFILNLVFTRNCSKISGIEVRKRSIRNLIYFIIIYSGLTYFHVVYLNSEIGLIESFIKTTVIYYLSKEILFAYIMIWIVQIFGREEVYTNVRCSIVEGMIHKKLFLEESNKVFLLNNRMIKRYSEKTGEIIVLEEIYIKSLFICNRRIITDMW